MHFIRTSFAAVIALGAMVFACAARGEPSPDVLTEPARDTFLLLPLNVHVLSCAARDDLDCKLADDDIRRIIGKVNGVWHKAGVHFVLGPILREKAERVDDFTKAIEADKSPLAAALGRSLDAYRLIAPADTRRLAGLHVYYIHQFGVNGVFLGQGMCVVKDTAALRPVKDGIDEPIPRVTSHELGHAMGLPHRQDVTNLMASGTTGTKLNQAEVEVVRGRASKIAGALTTKEWEAKIKAADEAHDTRAAGDLRRELDALPK